MKIEERYRLYDEAVTILEKEIRIVFESILKMERAAANTDVGLMSAAPQRLAALRREANKLFSTINKTKYAKVSFWSLSEPEKKTTIENTVWSTEYEKLKREIQELVEANGCGCECNHHGEECSDDCERCLACRIQQACLEKP